MRSTHFAPVSGREHCSTIFEVPGPEPRMVDTGF